MNLPPPCPICHHPAVTPVGRDGAHSVWRCERCVTAFVEPFPASDELARLYANPAYFAGDLRGGYHDYDAYTAPLVPLLEARLRALERPGRRLSVLDYGCSYGLHLQLAARRGWQCCGLELSDHARAIAQQRLGPEVELGRQLADLTPRRFDLVLMLDLIEHLPRPYEMFYELFRSGWIDQGTRILLTTPNGQCDEAAGDLLHWRHFHPPYHLHYFSPASLAHLLQELRFTSVRITGLHPATPACPAPAGRPGPPEAFNRPLAGSMGLLAEAQGSDFLPFMQERFVPGSWSALSAWEHMPRYLLARQLARNKAVLDFGCGTGYGSALLAQEAATVVGLDINADALAWARSHYARPNLTFADGTGFPTDYAGRFDVVVCFEVIEHLRPAEQPELVAHLARTLTAEGLLLISTPNPKVTARYGENPFHLNELDHPGFQALLQRHFAQIEILDQVIQPAVTFTTSTGPSVSGRQTAYSSEDSAAKVSAVCWLAVCSHHPRPVLPASCFLDDSADLIGAYLDPVRQLNLARLEVQRLRDENLRLRRRSPLATVLDALRHRQPPPAPTGSPPLP